MGRKVKDVGCPLCAQTEHPLVKGVAFHLKKRIPFFTCIECGRWWHRMANEVRKQFHYSSGNPSWDFAAESVRTNEAYNK